MGIFVKTHQAIPYDLHCFVYILYFNFKKWCKLLRNHLKKTFFLLKSSCTSWWETEPHPPAGLLPWDPLSLWPSRDTALTPEGPEPVPAHQYASTSPRRPPGPCSQTPQDPALPTSGPALAPRPCGPQLHPPAGWHQPWNPLPPGPSFTHHWPGLNPRTQPHLPVGGYQPWDPLGCDLIHQKANNSSGTPCVPQPSAPRSSPMDQWVDISSGTPRSLLPETKKPGY